MSEENTLLAHLAHRIAGGAENAAVEALAYILDGSESAASTFNALVSDTAQIPVEECVVFRTQVTAEDNSRPDLVGYDSDREKRVIVEAKFWAPLRQGQPSSYLHQLSASGPALLLFVVPEARAESLWTQIKEDLADAGPWEDLDLHGAPYGTKGAMCAEDDRRLGIVSWRSLLEHLHGHYSGEPLVLENIRQLRRLTARMDSDEVLPFSKDELGTNFPRRVMDLHHLFNAALDRGWDERWISPNGASWRRGTDNSSSGWYLRFTDSSQFAWIGVFYELWARPDCEETPLWVQLAGCGPDALNAVERALGVKAKDDINIPVFLRTGDLYEHVLDDVVSQLKRISDALKGVPSKE